MAFCIEATSTPNVTSSLMFVGRYRLGRLIWTCVFLPPGCYLVGCEEAGVLAATAHESPHQLGVSAIGRQREKERIAEDHAEAQAYGIELHAERLASWELCRHLPVVFENLALVIAQVRGPSQQGHVAIEWSLFAMDRHCQPFDASQDADPRIHQRLG